jgi:hypothetical protein
VELNGRDRRRRQARRRLRRLIATVIAVDLVGGGALAYALTRPNDHPAKAAAAPALTVLSAATAPPTTRTRRTTSTTGTTSSRVAAARRRHRSIPAATQMSKPSQSRAPTLAPSVRAQARRGCSFHLAAARHVAESEQADGYRIGFAMVTSAGRTLAAAAPDTPNYGASITKSMLLVAFLRDWATDGLSATDRDELTAMIEVSDNNAADWVYEHLRNPSADVERVAGDAGMTGFHPDTTDPVYVLGQSLVTAGDFARFFSNIETLMPASGRRFGMSLLAGVQERVGLLAAGLPGTVYSKEGWKPENAGTLGAPYVVNQAAQFTCRGVRYGIAVTVGQATDQATAESVVQRIASALTQ